MIIISQKSSSVNINWECPHLYDEWNVLIGSYISPKEIFIRKNIEMYIVYKPSRNQGSVISTLIYNYL